MVNVSDRQKPDFPYRTDGRGLMSTLLDSMALKVLSALIAYPTEPLVGNADEIAAMLQPEQLSAVEGLLTAFRTVDLARLQEHHAAMFDRTRKLARPLFEHLSGAAYHGQPRLTPISVAAPLSAGFYPSDDLPSFVETLAAMPVAEAQAVLAARGHILAAIEARLIRYGSAYSAIVGVLGAVGRADTEFGGHHSTPFGFGPEEWTDETLGRQALQRARA
jgi:nitrate reductase assembly molybdenum cofactor insertion protein NarJ